MPALRPSLRLVPAGQPPTVRRRWLVAAVSLALHALLVLLLVLLVRPREQGGDAAAPSYELMFQPEGAPAMGNAPPAAAPPAPPRPDSLPGPSTPEPESTPDVAAPPSPESPPAPEMPPQPTAPPMPAPPEPPVARQVTPEVPTAPPPLPQAPEAPEAEVPPPTAEASVRLAQPEPPPSPTLPRVPEFVPPKPPPPLPAPPLPAPRVAPPRVASVPPPPPRMAPPPGTFANPMDLSFGTGPSRPAAPRLAARPGSVASRSLDLGTGAARAPNRQEAYFDARAARLGADWKDGLEGYWLRHRYYPRQAAESGEDGQVQIELTVNRYGKVEGVTVQGRSGSPWLDMAAVSVWRGAQLSPLPAEVAGDRITFSITINYILLR